MMPTELPPYIEASCTISQESPCRRSTSRVSPSAVFLSG